MKNVSHVPMECATLITWNSSGPNVTYCIQIFNSTTLELVQDEVCELKEPYFLFNTTCPDTENTYEVKVTAVTDVGSGLPSNLVEVVVLPGIISANPQLYITGARVRPILSDFLVENFCS